MHQIYSYILATVWLISDDESSAREKTEKAEETSNISSSENEFKTRKRQQPLRFIHELPFSKNPHLGRNQLSCILTHLFIVPV